MSRDIEPVDCGDFEVIRVTSKAFLVSDHCGIEVWIPRSELSDVSDIQPDSEHGYEGTLVLPEWLAVEKGLV